MKYKFKDMMVAGALALGALLFAGCDDEPDIKGYVYPEPVVTDYSPSEGYAKSRVTILGKDFGKSYEDKDGNPLQAISVRFGGVEAKNILSVNNECIVVEVPENAHSGKISLKVWTHEVEVGDFEVWESPIVSKQFTGVVNPGGIVTIEGLRFGSSQEDVQVRFGDMLGTVSEWSESKIVAVAPEGYATGALTLIVNGLEVPAGTVINPLAKGDVTIAYLKNYKQPFEVDADFAGQVGNIESGTWCIPAYWIVNEAAKNVTVNGIKSGGLQNNTLIMQCGWGAPAFANGKMYQTISLPDGKYKLRFYFNEVGVATVNANNRLYLLAVKGNTLPDIGKVESSEDVLCSYSNFPASKKDGYEVELEFDVTDNSSEVSIGFVATFESGNSWFRVREIKLEKL